MVALYAECVSLLVVLGMPASLTNARGYGLTFMRPRTYPRPEIERLAANDPIFETGGSWFPYLTSSPLHIHTLASTQTCNTTCTRSAHGYRIFCSLAEAVTLQMGKKGLIA